MIETCVRYVDTEDGELPLLVNAVDGSYFIDSPSYGVVFFANTPIDTRTVCEQDTFQKDNLIDSSIIWLSIFGWLIIFTWVYYFIKDILK